VPFEFVHSTSVHDFLCTWVIFMSRSTWIDSYPELFACFKQSIDLHIRAAFKIKILIKRYCKKHNRKDS
jgi:hypothetical protein